MPLVRISVLDDTPPEKRRAVGDVVHSALVEIAGIPTNERFQIVTACPADNFVFDRTFGGVDRQRLVVIEITMVRTLTVALKRQLYRRIADELGDAAAVRPDDVFVVLRENELPDWSQGNGEASLMP